MFFRDITSYTNVLEEDAVFIQGKKREAPLSSETLDTDEPKIRHHIPEDSNLQLLAFLTICKFVSLVLSNTK